MANMGMDFGHLTQVARPQMMPNAPIGAGAYAGRDYSRQQGVQQNLLQQATEQAKLQAEMQAQQAGEQMSPEAVMQRQTLRNNEVEQSNQKTQQQKAGLAKLARELEKSENQVFNEAANAFNESGDITDAYSVLETSNKKTLGKHTFGVDQEKDKKILGAMYKAAENTPGFAQKKELKGMELEGKLEQIDRKLEGAKDQLAMRGAMQEKLTVLRAANAKNNKTKETVAKTYEALIQQLRQEIIKNPSRKAELQPYIDEAKADKEEMDKNRAAAAVAAKGEANAAAVAAITGKGKGKTEPTPPPATGTKITYKGKQVEYASVPSGAQYTDPNGNTRTKK